MTVFTALSRKASVFKTGDIRLSFCFFFASVLNWLVLKTGPMGGQPKSKASSLSSAEVGRLWEEPTEETGPKPGSVGILALKWPLSARRMSIGVMQG